MRVGDTCVLLPTKARRRFVIVVGLNPISSSHHAEVIPARRYSYKAGLISRPRRNGVRRWVELNNLQGLDAPKVSP